MPIKLPLFMYQILNYDFLYILKYFSKRTDKTFWETLQKLAQCRETGN